METGSGLQLVPRYVGGDEATGACGGVEGVTSVQDAGVTEGQALAGLEPPGDPVGLGAEMAQECVVGAVEVAGLRGWEVPGPDVGVAEVQRLHAVVGADSDDGAAQAVQFAVD